MSNIKTATSIANNLPGLLLEADKVAHGFMRGVHGRRKIGVGETFWQFRQWQEGDSVKDIDWKQTAKSDDVFIKQMEWEAAQAAWLFRDASPTMKFSSSKKYRSKQDYAETLLLALSIVLLNGGERVSLIGTELPLQIGYSSVGRICDALPQQSKIKQTPQIKNNAQVVIISDFFTGLEELKQLCQSLAVKNVKGILIQINDKVEENIPYKGRIKFLNPASDEEKLISKVEDIADEYRANFLQHRESLKILAKSLGWGFLHYNTAMRLEDPLTEVYNGLTARVK